MMQTETAIAHFRGPWGVRIEIAPSILFLVLLIIGLSAGSGGSALIDGVITCAILLGSILLHELGHAWGALIQRVPVRRVVLHGGGGSCEHVAAGARASELIVAMGPIVNLALWALLSLGAEGIWATLPPVDPYLPPTDAYPIRLELAGWFWFAAQINLMLFIMNLIPVQPLDGGKLAHLALLRVLPEDRALQGAGALGLVFSVLWIPAMIVVFITFGFVLLFFPSLRMHWAMLRGGARLTRLRRR